MLYQITSGSDTPLKTGLRVHLFFFLDRRIPGPKLAAYLQQFCQKTGFYDLTTNKGGVLEVKYGIDLAPIRSSVQFHYTAHALLESGVNCLLEKSEREGFIEGESEIVTVPEIAADITFTTKHQHNKIRNDWHVANGYVRCTVRSSTANGLVTTTHYRPPGEAAGVRTGRVMNISELDAEEKYLRLYFEDESTPGSWYVSKHSPQIARRFGDNETIPLQELSENAYAHVRDELRWFEEIPHRDMTLTEEGFLPRYSSFVTARNALILAPTGSGKTTAVIDWMQEKSATDLVIYIAQTIPLVNQMRDDLTSREIPCYHYQGYNYSSAPSCGIFLSTNKSLPKILRAIDRAMFQRPNYHLIVDEIHLALDDFARSNSRLNLFRRAIEQAQTTLFMTGTMTETQRLMLSEQVAECCGRRLTEENYCCYEFASVKRNPLHIHPLERMRSDVVALLKAYQAKKEAGEPLPRTMILLPTSKLESYRILVEQFGLADCTKIVSRQENPDEEIEEARLGDFDLLVTSPLFSVGLNLAAHLERLWCSFKYINADTSRIIQTINRANRGDVACEVRIYAGSEDERPYSFPARQALVDEFSQSIMEETSFSNNGFDLPLMLDRLVYEQYRIAEQDTNKSLTQLISEDAFQNYTVVEYIQATGLTDTEEANKKNFIVAVKAAKEGYNQLVTDRLSAMNAEWPTGLFWKLRELHEEQRLSYREENPRTPREIESDQLAVLMHLRTGIEPADARKLSLHKLSVLFGDKVPWLSDTLRPDQYIDWAKAGGEKTKKIIPLVEALHELCVGRIRALGFAKKINQNRRLQDSFKMLVKNNHELIALEREFVSLAELREIVRQNNSRANNIQATTFALELTRKLLEPLGVFFPKVFGEIHYENPNVPTDWDFDAMVAKLKHRVALLEVLPSYIERVHQELNPDGDFAVEVSLCKTCRLFDASCCACGNPIDWTAFGIELDSGKYGSIDQCPEHVPARNIARTMNG